MDIKDTAYCDICGKLRRIGNHYFCSKKRSQTKHPEKKVDYTLPKRLSNYASYQAKKG